MAICPICNTAISDDAAVCPACGYRFHGEATQQFSAVKLDSDPVPEPASTESEKQHPTLTVKNGRQVGIVYTLDTDPTTIGRSPKCKIFLNDMTVSRSHAILERVGNGWSIQDDGSFNGVWVNNENIDHVMLHDGDLIQIGCFILKYAE